MTAAIPQESVPTAIAPPHLLQAKAAQSLHRALAKSTAPSGALPTGADAPALAITRNAGAKLHIFSEKPNKKVGKYLFIPILFVTLPQESKRFEIMNTAVRTIQDTPMAPYAGMMKSMEPSDMQAVILFLQDAMREAEETKRKADDEFLAKKLAEIKIDPDIDELVDWLRLTPEEAADERTRWILGLDRK